MHYRELTIVQGGCTSALGHSTTLDLLSFPLVSFPFLSFSLSLGTYELHETIPLCLLIAYPALVHIAPPAQMPPAVLRFYCNWNPIIPSLRAVSPFVRQARSEIVERTMFRHGSTRTVLGTRAV